MTKKRKRKILPMSCWRTMRTQSTTMKTTRMKTQPKKRKKKRKILQTS